MTDVKLPFEPGTISRDVLRRPIFLLGGMNALLLQIAEPRVAAGVAEHSDFTNRVFPRLRHTIELMVEIGLGDPAEADRALEEMEHAHVGIQGRLSDGSVYDAGDPELKLWVLATLIATVLAVEERYVGEFDDDDRSRYYLESLEMARILGVGDAPSDLDEFRRYLDDRLATVEVSEQARQIAHHVLYPWMAWIPSFAFAPLRAVAADLLPRDLREQFGLSLTPTQHKWLGRAQRLSRVIVPRLPNWIRTFPILRPIAGTWERLRMRSSL